jgi:hypothetical protein
MGGLQVQGQLGLHSETLSQKPMKQNQNKPTKPKKKN